MLFINFIGRVVFTSHNRYSALCGNTPFNEKRQLKKSWIGLCIIDVLEMTESCAFNLLLFLFLSLNGIMQLINGHSESFITVSLCFWMQGFHRSWNPSKVLEFENKISGLGKVKEFANY